MRKFVKYDLGILIISWMFYSCTSYHGAEKHFDATVKINAECIIINELLGINNIIKLDDYLILQNGSEGVEDFFFVYSCPEMDFLYSFAKRGRGPNEYFFPAIIKNTPGNILGFRDHATDKLAFYEVTDTCANLCNTIPFKSQDNFRFFWEITYVSDSLYLTKHQGYKTGATELWNIKTATLTDSLPNTFKNLPRELGKDYYTIFDDYFIAGNGNRFVLAYLMIDRIDFGIIDGGKMSIVSSVGTTSTPNFYLYKRNETTEFNVDRNIVYYENVFAGAKYVYALYSDDRLDNTERNHSSIIEIYDWSGSPVTLLRLDIPVAYFTVDEANRIIYAVNPELSEEQILKYTF